MSYQVTAVARNLPRPFEPCECLDCVQTQRKHEQENKRASQQLRPRRKGERSEFKLIADEKLTGSFVLYPDGTLGGLPIEILRQIFDHLSHSHSQYCFAFSCKKFLYVLMTDLIGRASANLRSNNMNGPWKQKITLQLMRNWVPKDRVKLCFACWRFMPYGTTSASDYTAMFDDSEQSPHNHHLSLFYNNWEVKYWLQDWSKAAEQDKLAFFRDSRFRCPICVLENQHLRLKNKGFSAGVVKGPVIPKLEAQRLEEEYGVKKHASIWRKKPASQRSAQHPAHHCPPGRGITKTKTSK